MCCAAYVSPHKSRVGPDPIKTESEIQAIAKTTSLIEPGGKMYIRLHFRRRIRFIELARSVAGSGRILCPDFLTSIFFIGGGLKFTCYSERPVIVESHPFSRPRRRNFLNGTGENRELKWKSPFALFPPCSKKNPLTAFQRDPTRALAIRGSVPFDKATWDSRQKSSRSAKNCGGMVIWNRFFIWSILAFWLSFCAFAPR